jgi:hypothetical protein
MKRLLSLVLVAFAMSASLAACGGGDKTETVGAKGSETSSAGPSAAATDVADSPAADGAPDGKDLCAYLKKIEPDLKAVGPIGASAQLAMGLSSWVEKHPDQQPADSMEMDATTTRACPDVRNAVLKDLDTKTFQEALG